MFVTNNHTNHTIRIRSLMLFLIVSCLSFPAFSFNVDMLKVAAGENKQSATNEERFYFLSSPMYNHCMLIEPLTMGGVQGYADYPLGLRDREYCSYLEFEIGLARDFFTDFPKKKIAKLTQLGFPLSFKRAENWVAKNKSYIMFRSSLAWFYIEEMESDSTSTQELVSYRCDELLEYVSLPEVHAYLLTSKRCK